MRTGSEAPVDLVSVLARKVVGQDAATRVIVPYIKMFQAGLAPADRPVGVFLLLGPTGTGKTKTVEAVAEALHGSEKKILRVDCGLFQMEHEVAKLIGAPPGYLGHRETQPLLTQEKLDAVTSESCRLSLVLFDEIEKAAASLTQLLLGILDKATLQLADGNLVNFENSLIFFTSNLGAREMARETGPSLGFQPSTPRARTELTQKLESIALTAVRKRFSPEFVNRVDSVITYLPLEPESLSLILNHHIAELQNHVNTRLGPRNFTIDVTANSRDFLLLHGTSVEYGARELKRTIHRHLTQPLAAKVVAGQIDPGAHVRIEVSPDAQSLAIRALEGVEAPAPSRPDVLIVDDNTELLSFLEQYLSASGWRIRTAGSARTARELFAARVPDAVVLDYLLPDGNGVRIAQEWQRAVPTLKVIVMSGAALPGLEAQVCEESDFPVLQKPFVAAEILNLIRTRLARAAGAGSLHA